MTGFGSRRAKLLQQDKKPMHKVLFWLYESESWCPELVRLLAAVRVRRTT
jgi:hypothetical protein